MYYRNVQIARIALALLPEDDNLSGLRSVMMEQSTNDHEVTSEEVDPYDSHLARTFVPTGTHRSTEQETKGYALTIPKGFMYIQWLSN